MNDAVCHRPMFRADAFDRDPNACAQGDDAGDNEEQTKKLCEKLLSTVGHLCHEPSLIQQTTFAITICGDIWNAENRRFPHQPGGEKFSRTISLRMADLPE
ncbi:MAG TPA: hypothetical protein VMD27_03095 [Candidatus Aquilonibacter sp.]|nr:hypothetical protein [Candidatus Aquilonibacter sp.]